jgi:hypothetical protein
VANQRGSIKQLQTQKPAQRQHSAAQNSGTTGVVMLMYSDEASNTMAHAEHQSFHAVQACT